jgi:sulfoxide reductase heme-binding subunit YedZ
MSLAIIVPLLAIASFLIVTFISVKTRTGQITPVQNIARLMPYARPVAFTIAILVATTSYTIVALTIPELSAALSALARGYGFASLIFLFIALTPGLIRVYFPRFALNALLVRSRRGLGLGTFLLASLHFLFAFINNLSASPGAIFFLAPDGQIAIGLAVIAFGILCILAMTSLDLAVESLGFKTWKRIHRLVYPATVLVIFHVFLIGSHYTNTRSLIPALTMGIALVYLLLESGATFMILRKSARPIWKKATYSVLLLVIMSGGVWGSSVALQHAPLTPYVTQLAFSNNAPKYYDNQARVNLVSMDDGYIVIDQLHDIPHVMQAMTMAYDITPETKDVISALKEGDTVNFTLVGINNILFQLVNITKT